MSLRRVITALLVVLLGVGLAAPALANDIPDPDPSDVTAQLDITKTADVTEVAPGETFTYTIEVGCSAISDVGCRGAITTDVIPEPLEIVENGVVVASGQNTNDPPTVDGQNVRVDWTTDIGAGATGLLDNSTVQVQIEVQVPEDVSHDLDGQTLTNNATAEATNAEDATASTDVVINVPLNLATTATKSFEPTSALAGAGTEVVASLGGSNDSNATVDTLVIQDPVDPTAVPNPFTYLGFSGFGAVTAPEGATDTTYEVYVDGAWVEVNDDGTLPPDIDPADVQGTRVTFTGAIPAGASASVDLDLVTTEEAAGLSENTTITNDVQSEVDLGEDSATAEDSADFTFQANTITVAASKSFNPSLVVAGDSTIATIGGSNETPFAIDSMTITEPSSGDFPDAYTFGGFTDGVPYPAGATAGTVTYQPSGEVVEFEDGEVPAAPSGGNESVTSFDVTFTGEIEPGAETSFPFQVDTDPDLTGLPTTVNNEVAVEGENDGATGDATADDDLYIYDEVIEPYIDKQVRPSQIIANPGEVVTVSLQGGTTERPNPPETETGTTGDADQIVIQDPLDPVEDDPWWNAFDLDSITQTPIPADAELTVYYYDTSDPTGGPEGDGWKVLTGPVAGPEIFSYDVPDDISAVAGGVRFVYDYTGDEGGFAPGTDLEPNFTSTLRPADDGRYESPAYNTDPEQPNTFIPNCAQTDATSPTEGVPAGQAQMDPADCPEIEIIPLDGEGVGDLIEKEYGTSSSGGNKSVIARSGDTIPSTLFWSTGGYSGFETVEITDVADPTIPVADSVYDAFDLIRVDAITPEQDPFLTYDQIAGVELWNGTEWIGATNDPCPGACDGTFPGMDLTAAEQESTLAVRLIYAESPTRADRTAGDLDAPPVGSGVARSIGNDRQVDLVWQVRDEKRSDGSPVLATAEYNLAPQTGVVRNTVDATGFPADADPVSDQDQDDVVITDVPITTTTDKNWQGGPLAIPSAGTPEDQYPLSRIRITTINTTPAKVDQLQITDPAPSSDPPTDPFNTFRLNNIAAINVPDGTETTTVTLTCPDGSTEELTRADALALTPETMPCDVVGVQVLFDGRIASEGEGDLWLDVRLRAEHRDGSGPVTTDDSPILDTAEGVVADVDAIQDCPPPDTTPPPRWACDQGSATIELTDPTFGIEAGKSIDPASQQEGDFSPVTVTLSAQNSGSARPYLDEITDDDPTFWNAVDFIQMDPSWELPQPIEFVQACYLSGGDFTATNVEADTVGGDGPNADGFTCQEVPADLNELEPGDLTLAEASAFINDAAATEDIHGLRFRFMAGDEVGWQNPAHPLIEVPFQVERRTELRTGGPVPTTRSDQEAAPGEDQAGIFNDTVEVAGESVLVGLDTRLEAEDTADAPYTHQHLTVGVEVDKQPEGEVQPGTVIPFELTYTNTGQHALTNPVFTDVLPSDAEGNQLIFDPDADPTINSPYSLALTGAAPDPPNGDPLPTDQDQITITESGDTITFEMPEGTVLEPGQTYTITIDMMLRPGLSPDDLLTNTDKIIADEPFDPDNCVPNYDEDTGECWDDTTVSPVAVAALSTTKWVKADVPVEEPGIPEIYLDRDVIPEGADVPDDYCDTAGDADGFYRAPCVPVTYPGDTETWKFNITNVGTLPMDQVIATDNLPVVGDTGMIVTLPRDTEWDPTFVDDIALETESAGATMTTFYSTSSTPCVEEVRDPINGECAEGDWLPYVEGTTDPGEVASLKFEIDFEEADLFDPAELLTISFTTRTTPQNIEEDFPVAWNTVATGGTSLSEGTQTAITATEGRKVGVTYPTGPIQLEKIVSGEGAEYAPDSFEVELECMSAGNELDLSDVNPVTLTPGDDPVEVAGLPWGAECTATENDQGQADQIIGEATVGGPEDEIGLISVENVFTLGDLSVTKAVDSDAVDQDGNPIEYGPFEVAVSCTYLGEEVWAEGYDAANPMTAEIADGGTVTFTGLPTGAECTVTEPDDADAANVSITPEQPVEVGDEEVTEVQVENQYDTGSLQLNKIVEGDALTNDPALAEGPFTMHVTCTLTDASHPEGEVVYDDDVVLEGTDDEAPEPVTIDNLPTGAECDIEETDDNGATTSTVQPSQVTIGDDPSTPVEVTATNTYEIGALTVTKAVESDAVDQDGNPISYGPFTVRVGCAFQGSQVWGDDYGPGNPMVRDIQDGEEWAITGLPVGATCAIAETDNAGAVETEVEPNTVIIGGPDGDPTATQEVSVTNTFSVGSLELLKESTGDALENNPDLANGPFRFQVTCTLTDPSHDGETVYDDEVVLRGESPQQATIDNLPTGAECSVEETGDGGATSVEIEGSPATIGDDPADPVTVTATNTFDVGTMEVTKTVETDAVDQDGNPIAYGPFDVAVTCRYSGGTVVGDGFTESPMEQTIEDGETWTITGLPVGARCSTTEPGPADAAQTEIAPEQPVVIEADSTGEVQTVSVTNGYDVGSLHLRKFVPEQVREFPISQGPFTFAVECTLTDATHDGEVVYADDIVLPADDNVDNDVMDYQIDDIAAGAECTVEETDVGAANAHIVTPQTVTITSDENHEPETKNVVVSNFFGAGQVTVTKAVDGPGAELYGAGPFEVSVECTYTDVNGEEQPLTTPDGATRELSADNDYTATYDPLLIGSNCTIEETMTGGANSTVITDADGNEVSEFTVTPVPNTEELTVDPMEFQVTNTFDTGVVKVNKQVTGPGSGPFEVELACAYDVDGETTDVDIPGGATRTLEQGSMRTTYADLPAGAECTLTETDNGGADSVTITPNDGDPQTGVVTVEAGATVALDVENVFDPPPPGGDDGSGGNDGTLPDAGADARVQPALWLGLALLLLGLATIVYARRRSHGG